MSREGLQIHTGNAKPQGREFETDDQVWQGLPGNVVVNGRVPTVDCDLNSSEGAKHSIIGISPATSGQIVSLTFEMIKDEDSAQGPAQQPRSPDRTVQAFEPIMGVGMITAQQVVPGLAGSSSQIVSSGKGQQRHHVIAQHCRAESRSRHR